MSIVIVGHTTSTPREIFFRANGASYTYGASYDICQKCLFIDKKCKRTGKKAMAFIQKRANYCLKYGGENVEKI